jgi:UPF0755 protein
LGSVVRASIITALATLVVVGIGLAYLRHWATTPLALREPVVVELTPGMSFAGFAGELQAANVIEHDWLFTTYARLHGRTNRIQAGEYRVAVGATPASLLADLVAGTVATYEVRIVEGATIMQVMRQLAATPKLIDDLDAVSTDTLLVRLQLEPGNAEGRFFPDTYSYKKGTHVSEILVRAHDRMAEVLEHEWESRAPGLPYATADDALIMASIIEKETGRDDERARISRVFVSRLQRAMRLQTDPAVIYGLGDAFDGNLTRDQLNADSPYNTYKQIGLPPTPIALPGLASIEAAMHPDDGDFLYFVARGDGSSEFSATLDQHLAAVRRYQLNGG